MNKTSLVIGLGIGQLYKDVLQELGHDVITVDQDPKRLADYTLLPQALEQVDKFDTVHICTPNYTHGTIALEVEDKARILFIEKPGLATASAWDLLVEGHPNTRIMMVKNNQYRDDIQEFKDLANASVIVNLNWINRDRVPNPGSWFTNKELAFGGVSRDLVPHLLSLWMAMDPWYDQADRTRKMVKQNWTLADLTATDYGTVNPKGTYNVDDYCRLGFLGRETMWTITADWRSLQEDNIGVEFELYTGHKYVKPLGLCPESAYKRMIETAIQKIDDQEFWDDQFHQDSWIHTKVEKL